MFAPILMVQICQLHQKAKKLVTYIKRQALQHDCLPSLLGGKNKWTEIVCGEENIIWTGPTRAAKAGQNSLVPTQQAVTDQPRKDPFHLNSISLHLPQFQKSAWVILLLSLWKKH